jgi:hypothetical protein
MSHALLSRALFAARFCRDTKNPNPLKARATTFYDPVHNALDKEAQCAWKEGEGSHWPSVYIQKPFMTL